MAAKKYLLLQRRAPDQARPSPAQMQDMFAVFNAWKEKFKANILDMGAKLKPEVKLLTSEGLIDGPFIESKEIVGGYMVVTAESFEEVLAIAKEGPGMVAPGSQIEIREMVGS
jgi:hypothetical protein